MADRKTITDRLESVFNGMVELKVVTAVGPVGLSFPEADGRTLTKLETEAAPITDAIVTIFDMVDGDVTNVISPNLRDDEGLRAFHAIQVEKSLTVLPANLRALLEFGKALIDEIS